MCGRAYHTYTEDELRVRYLNKKKIQIPKLQPNYNLAPTQDTPVVRVAGGDLQIDLFRWGLVPPWESEFKTKLSTINAKSETVFESRLYKSAVAKRRCLVPLSGFIEWKRAADHKRPFCIHLTDEPIMSVAGIWGSWKGKDGEERHSFSIMTTEANSFMSKIHDRMPVILAQKDEAAWLDPENQSEKILIKFMKPCPNTWLKAFEVSTLINSPRNNREEVLKPLSPS